MNAEPIKPNITNIGFMKNPPQKLKNKFPMCDAFLKVTWIDKKKKIGYSEYNLYNHGGSKDKQKFLGLIILDENRPTYYFDIKKWKNKEKLQKLFSLLKQGTIDLPFAEYHLIIETKKSEKIELIPVTSPIGSFAKELLNVCIPYPDNQRMWIVEMRDPEKTHTAQELEEITRKIKIWSPNFSSAHQITILDINFDGIDDYYSVPTVISNGMQYFETLKPVWIHTYDNNYGQFYMSNTKKICKPNLLFQDGYLTTDGKNYFFNNLCNLTTGE